MLRLTDDAGRPHDLIVVDVHHHIGSEGQTRNLNPKEPNGSYDFFRGVVHGSKFKPGLGTLLRDEATSKYYIRDKEPFSPHPALSCLLRADERLARPFQDSWAIDLSVAFPMFDDFRATEPVEYRASNKRLAKVVRSLPNSLRFVPWGRVNPSASEEACQEIERAWTEDGIRGLKLHPKSDGFDYGGEGLLNALVTCARRAIPVIFHTDWKSDRMRIVAALDEALLVLARAGEYGAVSNMRVILGHFGWSADHEMIGFLVHPCVYGEVSGLHGQGALEFFKVARDAFPDHVWDADALLSRAPDPDRLREALAGLHTDDWSRKVMYGSDNPFLNQNNSIDIIGAILSREVDLTAIEVANILGLNALRLFRMTAEGGLSPVAGTPAPAVPSTDAPAPAFSSDIAGGQQFLETALRETHRNLKSVYFCPAIATDPHARLLPEVGLLRFVDREGATITLMSVLLEDAGRTGFMPHHETIEGPWTVSDPLCQEIAGPLIVASGIATEGGLDPMVSMMFHTQGPTDSSGFSKEV